MIALKYLFFAIIATALNLLTQALCFKLYAGTYSLYAAMAFGTAAGLISKYILDKRYIFSYQPANHVDDAHRFVLYTATGVVTTALFWATEIVFDTLWRHDLAKYVGAVLGLSIGYFVKYQLDKRYVFGGETS